jgi:hypothetical protein
MIKMKKLILLIMMSIPAALFAQSNGISLTNLATGAGTVTFEVQWNSTTMPPLWLDSAWVFVDYNNNGVMMRLPLEPAGATLTETSAPGTGRVAYEPNNTDGVWVVGNARTAGAFSASVKLFTSLSDIGGACAYASTYPPVGLYTSDTKLSFTGTLPYTIILKRDDNGMPETWTVDDSPLFTVPSGYTAQSFTDATGAPGMFNYGCAPGAISGMEEL